MKEFRLSYYKMGQYGGSEFRCEEYIEAESLDKAIEIAKAFADKYGLRIQDVAQMWIHPKR